MAKIAGHDARACEFRSFLDRIADKWSLLLIVTLQRTPKQRLRFSELKRAMTGISQRMLTTTLRNLERDGLLVREVYAEIPPRVEYELSPMGKDVMVPVGALMKWIEGHFGAIEKAREGFDRKAKRRV
jgi:DNA-binding HxlR family transcriptional regulator